MTKTGSSDLIASATSELAKQDHDEYEIPNAEETIYLLEQNQKYLEESIQQLKTEASVLYQAKEWFKEKKAKWWQKWWQKAIGWVISTLIVIKIVVMLLSPAFEVVGWGYDTFVKDEGTTTVCIEITF